MPLLPTLIRSIESGNHLPVLIMSEDDVILLINNSLHIDITHWDNLISEIIPGVHIYEKDIDKKELSIERIRLFLADIAIREYTNPAFYIIRDIDLASHSAMNALLKVFEDRPVGTFIICTATKQEALLETIRSRVIVVSLNSPSVTILSSEMRDAIEKFTRSDIVPLLVLLLHEKFTRSEAMAIITEYYLLARHRLTLDDIILLEKTVEAITLSNESTRNLLDVFFLGQVH